MASEAEPEKVGLVSLERATGFKVTLGASVSTTNVCGALTPSLLPMPLFSTATAVKVPLPLGSSLLSAAAVVDQVPPEAVVFAEATSVAPSKTWTTTSVASEAKPEKVGLVSLERASVLRVTLGASVSTSKLIDGVLLPSGLPARADFSVA